MTPRDLPRVVEVLTAAADPARVSPAALAAYAREAAAAHPRDEVALVAECALTPLSTPAVVGVVGVLFSDRIKPPEMKLGGQDVAYVTNLAVDELARRRGVGRALLRAAERAARRNGSRRVACRVDEDNDAARRMYDGENYAPFEPPRLETFRALVAQLYAAAGVAHAADLWLGPSALPRMAGAPPWAAMDGLERALAVTWCALGPLALVAERVGARAESRERRGRNRAGELGLIAYGAFETALAGACAVAFGAAGGDAATSAVAVQVVVFALYRGFAPGAGNGRVSLGKTLDAEDEEDGDDDDDGGDVAFVAMFVGFRARADRARVGRAGVGRARGRASDPRVETGWVALEPEPEPEPEPSPSRAGGGQTSSPSPREQPSPPYERDFAGRMVYSPRGYFYDGVREGDGGERFKVDVGVVGSRRTRTFALHKRLSSKSGSGSSSLVLATLERPLGITFEPDTEGRVRVSGLVPGSVVQRADAVARLGPGLEKSPSPRRGDVLRACTASVVSFGPRANLLGDLSGTKRAVVLFGADDQPWGKTVGALTSGLRADGPVTLVLERDDDPARAEAWTPEADENDDDDDDAAGSAGGTDRHRGGTARRGGDGSVGSAAGGGSRGSRGSRGSSAGSSSRTSATNASTSRAGSSSRTSATNASTSRAGSGLDANGERRRVGGGRAGVPDPVHASLAVALTAFVALIVTGFTTP